MTYRFNWITAGRPYAADMWDYDVYAEIGNYSGKVLLMHGDEDSVVPISYAERALETYGDVEYYVIDTNSDLERRYATRHKSGKSALLAHSTYLLFIAELVPVC